jgi:hypothetical protein
LQAFFGGLKFDKRLLNFERELAQGVLQAKFGCCPGLLGDGNPGAALARSFQRPVHTRRIFRRAGVVDGVVTRAE